MFELFSLGNNFYNTEKETQFIRDNYSKSQNISIDFGVLEKANNIRVLPVDCGWNDLGTWGSLYNKLPKDDKNNTSVGGDVIFRNASNNIVRTQTGKKVVIQGLDNFIVVEKDDVLLICPKTDEQNIKEITAQVKKDFGDTFV